METFIAEFKILSGQLFWRVNGKDSVNEVGKFIITQINRETELFICFIDFSCDVFRNKWLDLWRINVGNNSFFLWSFFLSHFLFIWFSIRTLLRLDSCLFDHFLWIFLLSLWSAFLSHHFWSFMYFFNKVVLIENRCFLILVFKF